MTSTILVRTISAGSRRKALGMMGSTKRDSSSSLYSIPSRRNESSDDEEDDDDEVVGENDKGMGTTVKETGTSPMIGTKIRMLPGKFRCQDPGITSSMMKYDAALSDDVISSMTRSFESSPSIPEADLVHYERFRWLTYGSIDPDSSFSFYWKATVTVAMVYNTVVIILQTSYTEMRNEAPFVTLDLLSDIIYLCDIFFESKTSFLSNGCSVTGFKEMWRHYTGKPQFVYDIISICPVFSIVEQIAYFSVILDYLDNSTLVKYVNVYRPVLRLNRLLKCHSMESFFHKTESRTNKPNLLRAFKLSLHLGVVIHWIACLYYMLSEYEGLGVNEWVYPSDPNMTTFSRKYIFCLFWSTMTLTTIGERPPPTTELEYVFTGFTFLIGVFVFAAVVGNVGDVISNMNAARRDFQARMDQIKFYLDHRKVPDHMQNHIKRWAEYTWSRTMAIDEANVLQFLPDRLRTEVAMYVHLETLKKVSIFDECEEGLLRELVLKLKPQIFSPGDYICRIGEIGNEFARTADVRSVGFSELLCLSRRDIMATLTEFPEAKRILEEYARQRFYNTKKPTPPGEESNKKATQQMSSVTGNKKKSAKQIFSQIIGHEGFAKLLTKAESINNADILKLKKSVDDLNAARVQLIEENFLTIQKKAQHLEQILLEKNLELQECRAQVIYLESVINRIGHHHNLQGSSTGKIHEPTLTRNAQSYSGLQPTSGLPKVYQINTVQHGCPTNIAFSNSKSKLRHADANKVLGNPTSNSMPTQQTQCKQKRHLFRTGAQRNIDSRGFLESTSNLNVSFDSCHPSVYSSVDWNGVLSGQQSIGLEGKRSINSLVSDQYINDSYQNTKHELRNSSERYTTIHESNPYQTARANRRANLTYWVKSYNYSPTNTRASLTDQVKSYGDSPTHTRASLTDQVKSYGDSPTKISNATSHSDYSSFKAQIFDSSDTDKPVAPSGALLASERTAIGKLGTDHCGSQQDFSLVGSPGKGDGPTRQHNRISYDIFNSISSDTGTDTDTWYETLDSVPKGN